MSKEARERAFARLAHLHPEEFNDLYQTALKKLGEEPEPIQLAPQPPAHCDLCSSYHGDEHRCLHCGSLPSRVIDDGSKFNPILVPADLSDERINAAIEEGRRKSKYFKEDDIEEDDDENFG